MYGVKMLKIKLLKKTGQRSCLVLFPPALYASQLLCSQLMGFQQGFYFLLNLDVLVFQLN